MKKVLLSILLLASCGYALAQTCAGPNYAVTAPITLSASNIGYQQVYIIPTTSGTVTIDWNNGPVQYLGETGDVTLNTPVNSVVGHTYFLSINANSHATNTPGGDACSGLGLPAYWKHQSFGIGGVSFWQCVEPPGGTQSYVYQYACFWDGTQCETNPLGDVAINRSYTFHTNIYASLALGSYEGENFVTTAIARTPLNFNIHAAAATTTVPWGVLPIDYGMLVQTLGINVTAFTCSGNPTVKVVDCGTSPPTTCASPTATVGTSATISGTGYADITISTAAVGSAIGTLATHYLAALFASGTCTVFDATVNGEAVTE